MEILNMTPDSFSDGGLHDPQSPALTEPTPNSQHVSIFDIGGQSSAPGAEDISSTTEIERVRPLIEAMRTGPHRDFYEHRAISVDTYRADVAEAAINAGADIINDISAGQLDQEMLATAARLGKTICLMHMRGTPSTMSSPSHTVYPSGVIPGVARELLSRLSEAEEAGIRRWRIILYPGIGFAKTTEQNLELLRGLGELRNWPGLQGLPWLVGTSRKSFIGNVTGVQTPKERTWGTAVTVAAAVSGGADVIRVHDIKEMEVVVSMADAIWRGWEGKLGEKNRLRAL
jgi:2-amino-4-hydroxy-6-hydroxymethyldihydropteridine diphosphokinase/dihydropteroate synthase